MESHEIHTPNPTPAGAIYDAIAKAFVSTGDNVTEARFRSETKVFLDATLDFDRALAILLETGEALGLVTRDSKGHFRPRKSDAVEAAENEAAATAQAEAEAAEEAAEEARATAAQTDETEAEATEATQAETEAAAAAGRDETAAIDTEAATAATEAATAATEAATAAAEAQQAEDAEAVAQATATTKANEPDGDYWAEAAEAKNAIHQKALEHRMGSGRKLGDIRWSELPHIAHTLGRDAEIAAVLHRYCTPATDDFVRNVVSAKVVYDTVEAAKEHAKAAERAGKRATKKAAKAKAPKKAAKAQVEGTIQ